MKCHLKHRKRYSKKHESYRNTKSNKGHTWQKLMKEYIFENSNDGSESHILHIGRKCVVCGKVVLNARGEYLE